MKFKNKQFLFYLLFICFLCLNINAQQPESSIKILTVNYCDLVREPVAYNNKIIRIKAFYVVGFEGSVMYDDSCKEKKSIWVEFDSEIKRSTGKDIWKRFDALTDTTPIIKGNDVDFPTRKIGIIWIGLFQGTNSNGGYGHMDAFDYLFTAQKIEEVNSL